MNLSGDETADQLHEGLRLVALARTRPALQHLTIAADLDDDDDAVDAMTVSQLRELMIDTLSARRMPVARVAGRLGAGNGCRNACIGGGGACIGCGIDGACTRRR